MRTDHISVCVCTFKRPRLLLRTLDGLATLMTEGHFTFQIIVADNDRDQSACAVVQEFMAVSPVPVSYCVEPQQNIALARNQAISRCDGDLIAFIDDDEVPKQDWLLRLFGAMREFRSDGVLGPVVPYFDLEPPAWVTRGRFFDRPNHPNGCQLDWEECRSGNVLFKRSILIGEDEPFRSQFNVAGEDMDFFRRMIDNGYCFTWCREAPVYELVPKSRCNRSFLLKRALLRGSNFPKHPTNRVRNVMKSIAAVPAYTLALPLLLVLGQHLFLRYLIKLFDHGARLLAFAGITLVKEREI